MWFRIQIGHLNVRYNFLTEIPTKIIIFIKRVPVRSMLRQFRTTFYPSSVNHRRTNKTMRWKIQKTMQIGLNRITTRGILDRFRNSASSTIEHELEFTSTNKAIRIRATELEIVIVACTIRCISTTGVRIVFQYIFFFSTLRDARNSDEYRSRFTSCKWRFQGTRKRRS